MKAYLASLKYFSKIILREKMTIIVYFIFPLVLIFILGSVFKSENIDKKIDKARIAIVTPLENEELRIILKADSFKELIDIEEVFEEAALKGLDEKKYDAIIYLNAKTSKMVVIDEEKIQNRIVKSIIEAYEKMRSAFTVLVLENNVDTLIKANNLDFEANYLYEANIIKDKPKSAMDYYGVTIVIMLMLYGGLIMVDLFGANILGSIALRVNTSSANKSFVIFGMLSAALLITLTQIVFVIIFTGLAYGVNWGSDYLTIFLSVFAACLFANLMAMNYLLLTKSAATATTLSVMTAILSSFFSGGYAKIDFGSAQKVFNYLPSASAQNAIFSSIYGGEVLKNILVIFAYALIALLIFIPLARRKK